jgi:hypothetical protein
MINLNDNSARTINVLGEEELTQVVGGCHRGYRRDWGYGHCGSRRDYDKRDGGGRRHGSDERGSRESNDSNVDVSNDINIDITVNQIVG